MDSAETGTTTRPTSTPVDHSGCFGARLTKINGNPNDRKEGAVEQKDRKITLAEMSGTQAAKEGNCYAVVSAALDTKAHILTEIPSEGRIHIYTVDGDYVGTVETYYHPSRRTN